MIKLEQVGPTNAPVFKNIRLRALQDAPTAFSSTYAKESKLSDADWLQRTSQWNGVNSVAYLAMDGDNAVGIAAGVFDSNDPATREPHVDVGCAGAPPAGNRSHVGRRGGRLGSWAEYAILVLDGYQQQ